MKKKYAEWIPVLFSFLTVLLVILLFHCYTPFTFSNSDDFYLKAVVSGELTGTPQAHMLHMNYLTGLILSGLYRLLPSTPWYGLFLIFCLGISMVTVLYGLLRCCHTLLQRAVTCFFFLLVSFCILLQYFSEIQYTTVAGMVCAAAVFYFFITDFREKHHFLRRCLPVFLLLGLSWCIRYKAALMLMPVLLFLACAKWVSSPEKIKEKTRRILSFFIICISLFLSLSLIDFIGYRSPVWHTFKNYNSSREAVYDYQGYPDYSTWASLYTSLGITRSSYQAASAHYELLLDSSINAESMSALARTSASASSDISLSRHLISMGHAFLERQFSKTDRPISILVFLLYFSVFILLLQKKNRAGLLSLLGLVSGRMVIWFYLLWVSRYPFRVTQTIYLTELFVLMGILCLLYPQRDQTSKMLSTKWIPSALFGLLLVLALLHFGIPQMRSIRQEASSRLSYSTACQDIQKYMDSNPDCFYLCDTMSMTYFTEDALSPQLSHKSNRVLLGSWMAKSPWYDEIFRQHQISDIQTALFTRPKTYVLIMDIPGADSTAEYITDYYQENFHASVKSHIIATVTCSGNVTFRIIQFSR